MRPGSAVWPLHLGGFIGPFGGAVVTTMLPELAADLHTTVASASVSLTAYMIPFAALMLFSGTLAERFGRRRTVRLGYLVYAVASLLCALAPSIGWLLVARGVQGAANAFITPVLVAAISTVVAPQQLGRALGLFGSLQALGQTAAPLIGGLAADVHWTLAFYGSAVVALLLAFAPPPDAEPQAGGAPSRSWRGLLNRSLATACAIAALGYLSSVGVSLLGALIAYDRFGLGPAGRGAAVAAFGVAGMVTGRWLGGLLDRVGRRAFGVTTNLLLAIGAAGVGSSPALGGMVAAVAVSGAGGTGNRTIAYSMAVTSSKENRSGATSFMLACQFGAAAIAPLLWIPIYQALSYRVMLLVAIPAVLGAVLVFVSLRERAR